MQIVTHVLTSPQSELRADTEEASARRKAARQNIGAVAGIKTESGPIEPDSEGYVQIPEVVDADENTKGIVKLTDDPTSDAEHTAASPAAIRAALADFGGFQVVTLDPVTKEPAVDSPSPKYIYLTKDSDSHETDPYTEWIWVVEEAPAEPHWDIIGTTSVDLSGYVEKVSGGTTGNVATLTNDGSIADSLIAGTDVADAVEKKHEHLNKAVLDNITAAYTTAEQTKLSGIAEGAQVNVIEHITANGTELSPSSKTVNIPLAGNGDPGLMTAAEKTKLTSIETSAQVNVIEHIMADDTELSPDNKIVTIPLATDETDGLLPAGMIGGITTAAEKSRIPTEPVSGADRIYSFDDDTGTSWQQIVKEYVGNMILDQLGNPVKDEEGEIMYEEEAVPLWLSYKGVEFGARRAYDDHTGANIHDSIASRTTMAQVTTAIETALANYGGFVVVDSLVDGHPDVADPSERFIYLYKDPNSTETDPYTEWIYTVDNEWDVIGTTSVDLTPYYTKQEVDLLLATKVDKVTGKGLSTEDYTTEEKTKLSSIESGAQINIIESVKVDGTALFVDANKAVDIPLASATESGNETVYVTGAVTGQDKAKWDNWEQASIVIPSPVKQYLGIAYLGYSEGITIIPSHAIVKNYIRFDDYPDLKSFDWKFQCNDWNDVTITNTPEILNLWKNNHDFTIETMFNTHSSMEWLGIGWGNPGYSGGGILYSNPYWNTPFMISFAPGSVYIFRNGSRVQTLSTSVSSGDAWHHVAITYTATTGVCTIYMDGNSIGTYTITGTHETCSNFTGSFGDCVTQFAVYDYVAYTENFSVPTIPHIYNSEYALKQ